MALAKGTNAYVTVAEADAYMADKLDTAAWSDATPEAKAQAVVTATRILDDIGWIGTAISESQTLAFPRYGNYFDPRQGRYVELTDTVPLRIEQATIELAYHLLNNDGILDDTGSILNIQVVGAVNLGTIKAPSRIPRNVGLIINPLRLGGGSRMCWRAN